MKKHMWEGQKVDIHQGWVMVLKGVRLMFVSSVEFTKHLCLPGDLLKLPVVIIIVHVALSCPELDSYSP